MTQQTMAEQLAAALEGAAVRKPTLGEPTPEWLAFERAEQRRGYLNARRQLRHGARRGASWRNWASTPNIPGGTNRPTALSARID